jgi:predicted TIM-barrel fold metal-dependent hydrolase
MVVDSHTHAWGLSTEQHPWVNERLIRTVNDLPTPSTYTAERLLDDMDDVGIDEAIVVGLGIPDWRDNWYVTEAVEKHDRLAGIGLVDPFEDDIADRIERLMTVDDIIGVRLGPIMPRDEMWEGNMDAEANWLPTVLDEDSFWAGLEVSDAALQLLADTTQLDQVLAVVEEHPDVTYIVDHFARVDPTNDIEDCGFTTFEDLTAYDVTVKVSAAPTLSNEPFPYRDLHELLLWLLDRFGRERLFWGSDQPMVSKWGDYDESLDWIDHVEELSEADRSWLTRRSFKRAFDVF